MKLKDRKLTDLIGAEYNPRILTEAQHKQLEDSLKRFGCQEPVIINIHKDRKNIIISGHQRCKVWAGLGKKTIPCIELNLNPDEEKELNIRMNKNTGKFNYDMLANHFDQDLLIDWGFTPTEFGLTPDLLDIEEDAEADSGSDSLQSDDKHSKFELVMLNKNKLALVEVLNDIKKESQDDSIENALMIIVNHYKTKK